mgnify:CR=1 FL=1
MLLAFGFVRKLVLAVVLAVVLVVVGTAVDVWWVARADDHPKSDAIVVLGAALLYNERITR